MAQPIVPIPNDYTSPAITADVSVPLSNNGKTRGLKFWMVTCFDLVHFKVPSEDPRFSYMIYQVEQCPDTGRHHIQAYLELKKQTPFQQVKAMFSPAQVHLEGRKAKTPGPAIKYCSKEETRVTGPFEFGQRPDENAAANAPKIDWVEVREKVWRYNSWAGVLASDDPDVVRATAAKLNYVQALYNSRPQAPPEPAIVLRKWQKKVLEMLAEPVQKRRIIWIWSEASGTGKTTFFDYCSTKFSILPGADWTNTMFVYDGQSVLWYDRTRAQSGDHRNVDLFYSDLERASNATLHTSTKYVGCRKYISCHVVVTANSTPDDFRLPGRFVVVEAKTKEQEDREEDQAIEELDQLIETNMQIDIDNDNAVFPDSDTEYPNLEEAEEPEEPIFPKTQPESPSPDPDNDEPMMDVGGNTPPRSRSVELSWARSKSRSPTPTPPNSPDISTL